MNYDQAAITAEIEKYDRAGYQIAVRAQGDRALDMLLNAFARAMGNGNPHRCHIVHAGNLTTSQIDRIAELNLLVFSQANFFSLLGDGFIEAFGFARSQKLYRFGTLIDRNIRLALSSVCPVADPNPLVGIRDAVCRRTASGQAMGPSESISAEQALALYTLEAAHVSFEEAESGTIQEGKLADLVVLDKDPLKVPSESLPECRVDMTIVGADRF